MKYDKELNLFIIKKKNYIYDIDSKNHGKHIYNIEKLIEINSYLPNINILNELNIKVKSKGIKTKYKK